MERAESDDGITVNCRIKNMPERPLNKIVFVMDGEVVDEKSVIHPTRGVSGVMAEQKRRSSEYSGLPERSGKAMIGKDF